MFKTIRKTDASFDTVSNALEGTASGNRFDYDGLIRAYNELEVGEHIFFVHDKKKTAALANQLQKRGLKRNIDVRVTNQEDGDNEDAETAFITKLSDTAGSIPESTRGTRKMTEEQKVARKAKREANAKAKAEAAAAAAGTLPKGAATVPAGKPGAVAVSAGKKPTGTGARA